MSGRASVVPVLSVIGFLVASQTMILALLPLAGSDLGLNGKAIGLLLALPGLMALLCDVPVAVASDMLGRRTILVVAGLLGTFGSLVFGVFGSIASLVVADLGLGLFLSLALGTSLAYVTEVGDRAAQPTIQGSNGAVQSVAALGGAMILGVTYQLGGPRTSAVAVGVLTLLVGAVAAASREPPRPRHRPELATVLGGYRRAFRLMASTPELRIASVVTLAQTSHSAIIGGSFVPLLIVRGLGASATFAGAALALRNLAAATTSPFFAVTMIRFGLTRPVIVGGVFAATAVLGMSFTRDPVALCLLLAIQGIGIGLAPATANTFVAGSTRAEERALGFAAQSIPARVNSFLLPLVLGFTLELADIGTVFVVAAVATSLFTLLLVRLAPQRKEGQLAEARSQVEP